MKTALRKATSLGLVLVILLSLSVSSFAEADVFDDGAYTSILTGSDFQTALPAKAYDRFYSLLSMMKRDGLETPHSMLVGGDFSLMLFDCASPGITMIEAALTETFPDTESDNVVCIQGNHDNTAAGFTETGFYDMGEYCLYCINENDFPWLQNLRPCLECGIKALAGELEDCLNGMIAEGDRRPVIVMTHVPLHYTERALGGDNMYASYLFEVLNRAGETLDITFLFGHNHSRNYDDYIGGAVNFMAPGDTILIPSYDLKNNYTEEKLNFVYTNYGYLGYSLNAVSESTTDTLTLGLIRLCEDSIRYVKYSEDGLYSVNSVKRKNPASQEDDIGASCGTELISQAFWELEHSILLYLLKLCRRLTVFV